MNTEYLSLILIIFLSLSLLFWVVLPLFRPKRAIVHARALNLERATYLLGSLKDLYASREEGQEPDQDSKNVEIRLITELAKLYESMGVDPAEALAGIKGEATAEASAEEAELDATEDEEPGLTCYSCGMPRDPGFAYCGNCGASFKAA